MITGLVGSDVAAVGLTDTMVSRSETTNELPLLVDSNGIAVEPLLESVAQVCTGESMEAQIARLRKALMDGEREREELQKKLQENDQKKHSEGVTAMMLGAAAAASRKKKTDAAAFAKETGGAASVKKKGKGAVAGKRPKGKEAVENLAEEPLSNRALNEDTLEVVVAINNSFSSGATETEDEMVVADDDASEASDGLEEVPVVARIISGRVVRIDGASECRVKLTYEKAPLDIHDVQAVGAVLDDPEYKILRWIMKNKSKDRIWRKQISAGIEGSKNDEITFFGDWVDWDTFIKDTEEGVIEMGEDGGGKPRAKEAGSTSTRKPGFTPSYGSPLKIKKSPCFMHNFAAEDRRQCARKGTGWTLDDIVCQGFNSECGKEFVEFESEAKIQGNGLVVSRLAPAYWCRDCNMVLCCKCYSAMLFENERIAGGRSTRRKL